MRATKFARDSWPEQKPGEVMTAFDQRGQVVHGSQVNVGQPRSWEELDCPDEIELEISETGFTPSMRAAGLSTDRVLMLGPEHGLAVLTCQAEDCWYAGVPRGRRLVLRRI